ncbi:hypothetical protein U14_04273 [Candidatus Moduliflexus flocculans]|uniref:Lipoprotein n=1 Tax=Candidatus Moduliflexus flocculans TaxID=1499966 RepID=A0A0S6W4U5_9BACT|nr:hypothetical protein U14_04273 [Candidatus Moduliflexus flocculans]
MNIQLATLTFILAVLCGNGCASSVGHDDPWFGADKYKHAAISAGIAAGATITARHAEISESSAPIIGFSTSFAVGLGKEAYDLRIRKTFWSWKDLCWDIFGSVLGSVAASQ